MRVGQSKSQVSWRSVGWLCAGGLLCELVLFGVFSVTRADDLDLLLPGATGATNLPPPNIVFLFDTSGTMNNLLCADLEGTKKCDEATLRPRVIRSGVSVCESSVLAALLGPDVTADALGDPYTSGFDASATTFTTFRYPYAFENGSKSQFDSASVLTPVHDQPWTEVAAGGHSSITDSTAAACNMTDCVKKSRCIYSLRTQGYFWEPTGSTCGVGDPMSLCATACGDHVCDPTDHEDKCTCPADCGTDNCTDNICCAAQGETTANCPHDCGSSCGDGTCTTGENSCTCPADCGATTCGDGLCCSGENACNCGADCGANRCGDGVCCAAAGETTCTCPGDCGAPSCGDGVCCAGEACTCPGDCPGAGLGDGVCCPGEQCTSDCPTECGDGACCPGECCVSDCGAPVCGDGTCCASENKCTCPADCGTAGCGDGICCASAGENKCTCAADCGSNGCGDGICCAGTGETVATCPWDCKPPPGTLGAPCNVNGDCNGTYKCKNNVCSQCRQNSNCTGGNTCIKTGCIHYYCSNQSCTPGGGIGGSAAGGGSLSLMSELAMQLDMESAPGASLADEAADLALDAALAGAGGGGGGGGGGTPATIDGPLFTGDFLNFYPPKAVGLMRAFNDAIVSLKADVRIGATELPGDPSEGGIKPRCNELEGGSAAACMDGDPATACFSADHNEVLNMIGSFNFTYATKPLAKALDTAAEGYFTKETGMAKGICDLDTTCSTNSFIVLVTDGRATYGDVDPANPAALTWSSTKIGPDFKEGWAANNGELLDEVAKALARIDHRGSLAGDQTVGTYTVSFGATAENNPDKCTGLLELVAAMGTGKCIPASNTAELEDALLNIITEIINRVRGFTAPSVPATRFSGTSYLANAVFRPSATFPLWEGHIYGFQICDERLGRQTGTPCDCFSASDPNEVCVLSADGVPQPIAYDDDGYLLVSPYWDAALCLAGDALGTLGPVPPDQANVDVSACYVGADDRNIYTAVASAAAPSNKLTSADQMEFRAARATLGSPLYTALGVGTEQEARELVDFYRGIDSYDVDGDGNVAEERNLNNIADASGAPVDGWWKLGDVFHSMPAVVQRPRFDVGHFGDSDSYVAFAKDNEKRPKALIIGANDGMLHAFNIGAWDEHALGGIGDYDQGTGEELWAFVSPEMLPRLKDSCTSATGGCRIGNHEFRVDGSVMVRDIWTGGTADKWEASNKSKWKTIVVYGHRDGGHTVVALDVTDVTHPTFLWQFPQPGSDEELEVGYSWLDTFPATGSIGPIRFDADNAAATAPEEKWVVLLSGGFDPLDLKGRGIYMLDAYSGNVLWKATAATTSDMDYSFPATPVFYADLMSVGEDSYPFIAGIVAADHGGQLWHFPVDSNGRLSTQLFFRAVDPPIAANTDGTLAASEYQRWPFFFAPTLTRHNGAVRVVIATGDRDHLVPASLASPIGTSSGYVCTDQQRLYAIDIRLCAEGKPCTEDDLEPIDDPDSYASPESLGWYYVLPPGEKAATPFQVFGGFAFYSTFQPTVACGSESALCSADAKGIARLHARNVVTGKPYAWGGGEVAITIGEGVPKPPVQSDPVSPEGITPTLITGSSDSGMTAVTLDNMSTPIAQELMRFPISEEMHKALHEE